MEVTTTIQAQEIVDASRTSLALSPTCSKRLFITARLWPRCTSVALRPWKELHCP